MNLIGENPVAIPIKPQGEDKLFSKAVPDSPIGNGFAPFRGVLRDSKSTGAWMTDTRQSSLNGIGNGSLMFG